MESLDEPPHSSASNKRVLLRRSLQAVPSSSEILDPDDKSEIGRDSPSRRVLLAHKIKPGQTIQLKGTKATATMRDDGQPDLHTESLVQRGPVGPMQDENGMLLSFSVLGPVEEYEEQAAGMTGHAYPPAAGPASTSTMMPPPPHHPRLDQLEAMEEVMRLKGESASQRQLTAESLRQKQLRTWHSQIGELSKSLKVPPAHLMMARTGDYRTKVQQREVLEALRRRQYPYGGERAWQIGLRNGGIFYEAIGNASNGIFCPFRAPDDSNALARAGALAQQAPADLTLAALESKILGERRGLMADEEALGMTGALSEAAPTGGGFEEPDVDDQPPPYPEDDDDDDYIDPEAFDVIGEAHLAEIARLRDKYNIEGAAPAHLSGDERVLWGIFKEIDTDESGSVSKQELYAAFAKMGLVTSAAEMLRLFREGDTDGNGRIDCDEFIALGKKVDVFSGAAEAFTTKDQGVVKKRRASQRIKVRKGSGLGPILSIDSERKVFESTVGKNIEQTVTMTNSGSCALYYEWVRRPIAVPGLGTSAAVDAANQFFVPRNTGCILPGSEVPVRFCFCPSKPGMFQEEWQLQITPTTSLPVPPVHLRGVCVREPEVEKPLRDFSTMMTERVAWQACQDILIRDVVNGVFAVTIPDDGAAAAAAPAPAAAPPTPALSGADAAAYQVFLDSYARPQSMAEVIARKTFDELLALAHSLGGEEGGAAFAWSGDVLELEEVLSGLPDPSALADMEHQLHSAAMATPDISRAVRLRHAASAASQAMLFELLDAQARTRLLYGKPEGTLSVATGLRRDGVPVGYCWETGTYEAQSELEAVGTEAREARLAKEKAEAAAIEWEAAKAAMSKRDRKKAEKKEAEDAANAAIEAEVAEAARLARPEVQHEMRYQEELAKQVQMALDAALGAFGERAAAVELESGLSSVPDDGVDVFS